MKGGGGIEIAIESRTHKERETGRQTDRGIRVKAWL